MDIPGVLWPNFRWFSGSPRAYVATRPNIFNPPHPPPPKKKSNANVRQSWTLWELNPRPFTDIVCVMRSELWVVKMEKAGGVVVKLTIIPLRQLDLETRRASVVSQT
jgi:hypothetical protein